MRRKLLATFIFVSLFCIPVLNSYGGWWDDRAACAYSEIPFNDVPRKDARQGFCPAWSVAFGCTNSLNDIEPRLVESTYIKPGVECLGWWNKESCCAPRNGLPWAKSATCLGHRACVDKPTCTTRYYRNDGLFMGCDDGAFCCDFELPEVDNRGNGCKYWIWEKDPTTRLEIITGGGEGICALPNECSPVSGVEFRGSCVDGLVCCSEDDLPKCDDVAAAIGAEGKCVADVNSDPTCDNNGRTELTDCMTKYTDKQCCITITDVPCNLTGFSCVDSEATCTSSNGTYLGESTDCISAPNLYCCDNRTSTACADKGGTCTTLACSSPLWPVYLDKCTNPNICCADNLNCTDPHYCEAQLTDCNLGYFEIFSSMCGLGKKCCASKSAGAYSKPSEIVYKGPVIDKLEDVLGPLTKILYNGGLALGVFFIILSGYRLMVSEGDPQRTKMAKEQLTSAVIGIIFILLSVTIVRVIIEEIIKM